MRALALSVSLACLSLACGKPAGELESRSGESAARAEPPPPDRVDACTLVTEAEATGLFGVAAARETGVAVTDPSMLGECIWGQDSETGSHQLQVRVWGSPQYFSPPQDEFTKPLDVGERGYVRVHSSAGVDIAWVQGGRVVELSYFTVGGASMPKAADRANAVIQLARQTSGRL